MLSDTEKKDTDSHETRPPYIVVGLISLGLCLSAIAALGILSSNSPSAAASSSTIQDAIAEGERVVRIARGEIDKHVEGVDWSSRLGSPTQPCSRDGAPEGYVESSTAIWATADLQDERWEQVYSYVGEALRPLSYEAVDFPYDGDYAFQHENGGELTLTHQGEMIEIVLKTGCYPHL